jgi:hypothetical protein
VPRVEPSPRSSASLDVIRRDRPLPLLINRPSAPAGPSVPPDWLNNWAVKKSTGNHWLREGKFMYVVFFDRSGGWRWGIGTGAIRLTPTLTRRRPHSTWNGNDSVPVGLSAEDHTMRRTTTKRRPHPAGTKHRPTGRTIDEIRRILRAPSWDLAVASLAVAPTTATCPVDRPDTGSNASAGET